MCSWQLPSCKESPCHYTIIANACHLALSRISIFRLLHSYHISATIHFNTVLPSTHLKFLNHTFIYISCFPLVCFNSPISLGQDYWCQITYQGFFHIILSPRDFHTEILNTFLVNETIINMYLKAITALGFHSQAWTNCAPAWMR